MDKPSQSTMDELRLSEERFRSAFEYAAIGMALVAPTGQWLQVNRSLCELVGYTETELLSSDFQRITHPEDLDADLEYVRQMLAGEIKTYQMEKRYFHKSGEIVWILLSVSLVRDNSGKPLYFISQIQDVTARKRLESDLRAANERLEALASRDGLTGLYNYRAFSERIEIELHRARRYRHTLSLALLDIDGFKRFNDTYGHPAGDAALCAVARLICDTARDADFPARYGGEEFAIILPHTDRGGAVRFAERLRAAIETAAWDKSPLTASIGLAALDSYPDNQAAELVGAADRALYQAKNSGRNRVCCA